MRGIQEEISQGFFPLRNDSPLGLQPAPSRQQVAPPRKQASPTSNSGNKQTSSPGVAAENTKGVVTFSSLEQLQGGYSFELRANIDRGKFVNITNWTIRTNRGEIKIPQAVSLYAPNYAPVFSDIVLGSGNVVSVSSGQSPLRNQASFRTNLCTGHLNRQFAFNPPLANECPVPPRALYQGYPGWCQRYIMGLSSCELPDANTTRMWEGREGYLCRKFIDEHFSFFSCVRNSIARADFFGNRWHVWSGTNINIFDPLHDWVRIYNKNGVLIDEHIY